MRLGIHKVVGNSMFPTLAENDYVISMFWRRTRLKPGDLVVVQHPIFSRIIKRITDVGVNGNMLLAGDHPDSTPTEQLGWTSRKNIIGKVVFSIKTTRHVN